MRNDVENGQEYLTTDVRRVVARYYFYASYFFVFFFLLSALPRLVFTCILVMYALEQFIPL